MDTRPFSPEEQVQILEYFQTMNAPPGKDSDKLAQDWLSSHNNKFTGFLKNKFLPESETDEVRLVTNFAENIATATIASKETIKKASESSVDGLETWKTLSGEQRSSFLQKIAQNLEKNADLFAQIESLSSGKHLHRTRAKDVPNLIQSFHYNSNLAKHPYYLNENQGKVICVIAEEYNSPLLSISWRVAPILAAGSVVLLLVDAKSCPSAFLLAEICILSGLPPSVVNILSIDQASVNYLPSAHLMIFTGEHKTCNKYRNWIIEDPPDMCQRITADIKPNQTLDLSKQCFTQTEIMIPQRPFVIVYESADLHSAANGVLEMLFFNDTRTKRSGCTVYVQASIKEQFYSILQEKLFKITVGHNFSKTDMSCIVTETQHNELTMYIEEARKQQLRVFEGTDIEDKSYTHWKPTLICDVPTTSKLLEKIVEGPIIITLPFRTVKESIAMFNHNKLGSDVSVWSEKLPLVLEVAQKLRTRTLWLNTENVFDVSVPYGGLDEGGNSIVGGKEGFWTCLDKSFVENHKSHVIEDCENLSKVVLKNDPSIKFSYELHIGGSYKKPSISNYRIINNSAGLPYAYIANGTSKDIDIAVSCASAAQPKWENMGKCKRLKILEKVADALKAKENEFAALLQELTGKDCQNEVSLSIQASRFWANNLNYSDGHFIETQDYGKVLQDRNPLGVIGIQICDHMPLHSFVDTVFPAIVYGNTVVVVANENFPIPSLKLCEILQASGVPGGTVNVITGDCFGITNVLAINMNIDAICHCDDQNFIQYYLIKHPKNVFNYQMFCPSTHNMKLIEQLTYLKSIYMPVGDIFAN